MRPCPQNLALGHLMIRLRPLNRALEIAIQLRDAEASRLREAGATADVITAGHARALLAGVHQLLDHQSISAGPAALRPDEAEMEARFRAEAATLGVRLPLDELAATLDLDDFELETLVLCVAAELDLGYERVLAFVQDDTARRAVSVELAAALTADALVTRVHRRTALGPYGRLRRLGLLVASGDGLHQELRLAPDLLEAMLGAAVDLSLAFRDLADVALAVPGAVPADEQLLARASAALAAGQLDAIAIWGSSRDVRDIVAAIAIESQLSVRRFPVPGVDVATAARSASVLGTALWIDLDALGERPPEDLLETCRHARVPLFLTAVHPWRPTELLAERSLVEIPVERHDRASRSVLWQAQLPELEPSRAELTAAAYRFDTTEIRAAARLARSTSVLRTNGHRVGAEDCLAEACAAVARTTGDRTSRLITPQRRADDLVLPAELYTRVLDIVHDYHALPRVMDDWGFARKVSGGGVKALFTGEPGTGKTLAAEVVAGELGLGLLRVDLARVVSKWIGETEKNLDQAFAEARDCHAVLFFDEAEALFGARGEVRHGTDRYANLEVSYLLQRLEDHDGVVILATNLRDKIDPAFMRRFHVVAAFPRPGERERRRLWERAFGAAVPMESALDLDTLARLDLTGAGIVGAAQSAAFFAAREGTGVSMRHVVRGLVRQYQREARVLSPQQLGSHAVHIGAS